MEEFDRFSVRVGLSGAAGVTAGTFLALLKGYPVPRIAGLTGLSCALAASACFGSERIIAVSSQALIEPVIGSANFTLLTHGAGGVVGGHILGGAYKRRPLQGVLFMTPLMLLAGVLENYYQVLRENRIATLEKEAREQELLERQQQSAP